MPYAAEDRQEFIERLHLTSEARVLDIGGMISEELPSSVSGITTPRDLTNPVLIDPLRLPFKSPAFDAVVSYHYFDMISPLHLGPVLKEISRVMDREATLSFMIYLWKPQTESQRSNLFFNQLLEKLGVFFHHGFESISEQLSDNGFGEITVESIRRDITIPKEFVRSHLMMVSKMLKSEKAGNSDIRILAKQYVAHVRMHGESLMPAVHFTAGKV